VLAAAPDVSVRVPAHSPTSAQVLVLNQVRALPWEVLPTFRRSTAN